jgi:hypothetical protein
VGYIINVKNLKESISSNGEKELGEDLSRTLISLVWINKEYNTQDQFDVWGMNVGLPKTTL